MDERTSEEETVIRRRGSDYPHESFFWKIPDFSISNMLGVHCGLGKFLHLKEKVLGMSAILTILQGTHKEC